MHKLRLLLAGAAVSTAVLVGFAPHAMAQEEDHSESTESHDPLHTVEEEA